MNAKKLGIFILVGFMGSSCWENSPAGPDAVDGSGKAAGDAATSDLIDASDSVEAELGLDLSDVSDPDSLVPPGCCLDNDDCDAGMVCVKTNQPKYGQCAAAPEAPSCYFPKDCPVLHGCFDAVYCECGEDCKPVPGLCGPANGECCEDDSDCPAGGFCKVSEEDPDNTACLALPAPGKCWDDSFCGDGETCIGAKWAGCAFMFVSPLTFGICAGQD